MEERGSSTRVADPGGDRARRKIAEGEGGGGEEEGERGEEGEYMDMIYARLAKKDAALTIWESCTLTVLLLLRESSRFPSHPPVHAPSADRRLILPSGPSALAALSRRLPRFPSPHPSPSPPILALRLLSS
ncbi:hypothetical protein ONZ51_g13177 [Trametes cubensis]|uniref:Uncharacterized protein n=1 Tax=Trametes cubensis TaxID=1111947 RepID=A0AAD7TF86_9APHY|nr:hypothetical protein ONZ51_g13177 [Trametes cubensis]